MKIAVVGSGYVGLVAGACLAENGNDVVCVDQDAAKIRLLQRGKIPIYEPGLEEMVRRNRAEKRLTFTTALAQGVRNSEIIFVAVGTPTGEDGSADLQHVLGVARDVAQAMNGYKVIVNKSTVPVGTAQRVREIVRRETTHPFSVVSNPEFLKQGAAIDDFMKPDRVVIGAEDPRAAELMRELYAPFTRTGAPDHDDGLRQRRAVQVRGERDAGDAHLVHERSRQRLRGGRRRTSITCGWPSPPTGASAARSCSLASATAAAAFPKDVKAMLHFAANHKYDFQILHAVEDVNEQQKLRLLAKMQAHFGVAQGQAHRRLGAGVQAEDRRHARGAGRSADQGTARRRRHGQAYDPEAMKVAQGHLRLEGHLRREQLCGADRRRCAGDRHRVERVPRAGLRADAESHAQAGHLRRPQHLQPRNRSARRASPICRWAAHERRTVTGGAGYIGSHAVKALLARGERVVVLRQLRGRAS